MASTSTSAEQPQEDGRPFYCHHCSHQWMKTADSQFECPQCGQGFIEEVTDDFHPAPAEQLPVGLFPRSPFFNLLFYQSDDMEVDDDPATTTNTSRRRLPRQATRARRGARQQTSRSRSPHVSLLVESNNGNAYRIGLNAGTRAASANRILSVAIDDIMDSLFVPGLHPRPPAMTEEQLQEIPKVTITEEQVQNELMCSVCFDDFQPNESEIRKLQCEHIFHEKCIFPWLKTNASCPVCRTKMSNATHQDDDNDNDEEFASLLRVLSEYNIRNRERERRAEIHLGGGAGNSAVPLSRLRRQRERLSSSDESEVQAAQATNRTAEPVLNPRPRARVTAHPLSLGGVSRRPATWVDTPLNLLSQRTTRSRRYLESVLGVGNQNPAPTRRARVQPSTSSAAAVLQSPPQAPTSSSSSSSSLGFASENYRTARVARMAARNRIAELANGTTTRRGTPIVHANTLQSSPTSNVQVAPSVNQILRRRNAIHSPRPSISHIPRPIRAARMNPSVITVSDSSSESLNSSGSESLPSRIHTSPEQNLSSGEDLSPIRLARVPTVAVPPIVLPARGNRHSRRQLEIAFRGNEN